MMMDEIVDVGALRVRIVETDFLPENEALMIGSEDLPRILSEHGEKAAALYCGKLVIDGKD